MNALPEHWIMTTAIQDGFGILPLIPIGGGLGAAVLIYKVLSRTSTQRILSFLTDVVVVVANAALVLALAFWLEAWLYTYFR